MALSLYHLPLDVILPLFPLDVLFLLYQLDKKLKAQCTALFENLAENMDNGLDATRPMFSLAMLLIYENVGLLTLQLLSPVGVAFRAGLNAQIDFLRIWLPSQAGALHLAAYYGSIYGSYGHVSNYLEQTVGDDSYCDTFRSIKSSFYTNAWSRIICLLPMISHELREVARWVARIHPHELPYMMAAAAFMESKSMVQFLKRWYLPSTVTLEIILRDAPAIVLQWFPEVYEKSQLPITNKSPAWLIRYALDQLWDLPETILTSNFIKTQEQELATALHQRQRDVQLLQYPNRALYQHNKSDYMRYRLLCYLESLPQNRHNKRALLSLLNTSSQQVITKWQERV